MLPHMLKDVKISVYPSMKKVYLNPINTKIYIKSYVTTDIKWLPTKAICR